jgi:hypothetical protein
MSRQSASALLLAIGILTAGGDAMGIEKLAYKTIEQDGRFELRRIEPHVVAETFVDGDFDPPFMGWFLRRNEVLIEVHEL